MTKHVFTIYRNYRKTIIQN